MDGLEKDLEAEALVARVNVLSQVGREMVSRHGVRSLPTFLVFDTHGNLIGREAGFPDRGKIESLVAGCET